MADEPAKAKLAQLALQFTRSPLGMWLFRLLAVSGQSGL